MFKMLSRKLLGENFSSALKNVFISVFIAYGLYSMGKQIPLSEKVLVLTVIVFSGTLVIQTLGSADNAKILRGLFDIKGIAAGSTFICVHKNDTIQMPDLSAGIPICIVRRYGGFRKL